MPPQIPLAEPVVGVVVPVQFFECDAARGPALFAPDVAPFVAYGAPVGAELAEAVHYF